MIPFAIDPAGHVQLIYDDALPLHALEEVLGAYEIQRASSVEPAPGGGWQADMAPSGGPKLPVEPTRGAALAAEVRWLHENRFHQREA